MPRPGGPQEGLPKAADELFAIQPKDFTRRRNELAKELKAAGDKEGSAAVAALSKPSLAAWALNQVARWNPKVLQELLAVDETLREPKSSAEFRRAAAERNQVVGKIVQAASEVLEKNDHSAGAGIVNKLTQTLFAVGTDDEARRALVEGRLVKDLETGGGALDLQMWDLQIDEPVTAPKPEDRQQGGPARATEDPDGDRRRRELLKEADRLSEKAENLRHAAEEARSRATEARREAERADQAAQLAEQKARAAAEAAERKKAESKDPA